MNELEFLDDQLFKILDAVDKNPQIKLSELAKIASVDISNHYVRADLSGNKNLNEDDLNDFNFSYGNLSNTNLSSTTLRNAKLIETNLRGADLRGADLRGADLRGADLEDILYDEKTTFPDSICYSKTADSELGEIIKEMGLENDKSEIIEGIVLRDEKLPPDKVSEEKSVREIIETLPEKISIKKNNILAFPPIYPHLQRHIQKILDNICLLYPALSM